MSQKSLFTALEEKLDAILNVDENQFSNIILRSVHHQPKKAEDGHVQVPSILVLQGYQINCCGRHELLNCSVVRELDLSNNKFTDWTEVTLVLNEIPNLVFLNLSDNMLDPSTISPDGVSHSLKKLAMCNTRLDWADYMKILQNLPQVSELHLNRNGISSVGCNDDDVGFPSVESLFINENPISRQEDMENIGTWLPKLCNLTMIRAGLSDLQFHSAFPHLVALNLSNNLISSWSILEKFCHFTSIVDVRLKGNPLFENVDEKYCREVCIALMKNVTRLNGSSVNSEERINAERNFVRSHSQDEEKSARCQELEEVHGCLQPLAEIDLGKDMSKDYKCNVLFEFEGVRDIKCVNTNLMLKEFKKVVSGWIKLLPSEFRVFLHAESICKIMELKFPGIKLRSSGVVEGCKIEIMKKITPTEII